MATVFITDGKYRSALAVARALGRAGHRVLVSQTREDCEKEPPVFASRFGEGLWIEGSVKDQAYPERLLAALERAAEGAEKPVLLCVGADTLNLTAARRRDFARAAEFLIAEPSVLDQLNDKQTVHRRGLELGLPVPREFEGIPPVFPVVIKPHCGEKLGLKAAQRYAVAENPAEFEAKYRAMAALDPKPIVQEKLEGPGRGVSLLLGRDSELLCAFCHRRLREYPMSGGPSTCCVTEYDEARIARAHSLLRSFGFRGLAMVEFKGEALLEVNPRIWGSFPLTVFAGSPMAELYVRAAAGEPVRYSPGDYAQGAKIRFFFNDLAASGDLLRHGKLKAGLSGLADFFRVPEALADREDRRAYLRYLRSYL